MLLGIVASMIAIGYAGFQVGRHLTNNKWERIQDQERQQQRVDWGVVELRSRIRWINDMRTDLRTRITTNSPPEVERVYLDLIRELEAYSGLLQGTLDSIAEKQQQHG